jgi:GR25 family glycosyltransferase involved in LPS biosynthesis
MQQINKIYYINLDRRPDRYEHFLKEVHANNIPFDKVKRFAALDGKTYKFSPEEKNMFKNSDFRTQNYSAKIMGNQLSHYKILQDMIENNYQNIIIFQDDVILRKGFIDYMNNFEIPEDAEIINIGYHKFAAYNHFISYDIDKPLMNSELNDDEKHISKKSVNNYVCLLNDTINPCSLAFIVTLKGAKNLKKHFEKIGFLRATDMNYNDYLKTKNIFYGSKYILCTGNSNLGSDIFS